MVRQISKENKIKLQPSSMSRMSIHLNNSKLESDVVELVKEQEKVTGANKKLKTLNKYKGQLSQKVATITKEHKFFY